MHQVITQTYTISEELKAHWKRAIELWLGTRRSQSTRRTYAAALEDLLASTNRLIWEIQRADVIAWAETLKRRGLSDCTIAQRLSGVSSFFRFAIDEYVFADENGRDQGLAVHNPAGSKAIRPRIQAYGKSIWLSPDEARALVTAIRRKVDDSQGYKKIKALRDFALIAGYLLTGRRNSEWRKVRIGDLERTPSGGAGPAVTLRWSGKGKRDQRLTLPDPVWTAIAAYLVAAGRDPETMDPGEYIFTPVQLRRSQPICSREAGRILKSYCRQAGLDDSRVHIHTLRHSAAMLRKEAGDGIEDICGFLGHSSLAITQIYTHSLEGRKDKSWGKVADMLGIGAYDG